MCVKLEPRACKHAPYAATWEGHSNNTAEKKVENEVNAEVAFDMASKPRLGGHRGAREVGRCDITQSYATGRVYRKRCELWAMSAGTMMVY